MHLLDKRLGISCPHILKICARKEYILYVLFSLCRYMYIYLYVCVYIYMHQAVSFPVAANSTFTFSDIALNDTGSVRCRRRRRFTEESITHGHCNSADFCVCCSNLGHPSSYLYAQYIYGIFGSRCVLCTPPSQYFLATDPGFLRHSEINTVIVLIAT